VTRDVIAKTRRIAAVDL